MVRIRDDHDGPCRIEGDLRVAILIFLVESPDEAGECIEVETDEMGEAAGF